MPTFPDKGLLNINYPHNNPSKTQLLFLFFTFFLKKTLSEYT